jgi:heat shock protein HtpX
MGARLVEVGSNLKEAQLLNIIEECTVASSLPAPKVYIIDAQQINAFAAGLSPEDAAIAVTTGALDQLSREELQGVIAHEFSHIGNGDMKIGLRLAAMLAGFYWLLYVASRILDLFEGSRNRNSSSSGRGGSSSSSSGGAGGAGGVGLFFVVVLMFFAAGIIGWILGSILKSAISCQREYLADASSAQYTRNPSGLANALRKILHETVKDMPKKGMFYSHLYLEDHSSFSLFETHPPLRERIRALEGIPTEAAL